MPSSVEPFSSETPTADTNTVVSAAPDHGYQPCRNVGSLCGVGVAAHRQGSRETFHWRTARQ
ncbi:hypothetical protein [Acutalibacter intestini]|uniref:hypothetical protein n=1 Tax=Acutalibacter intestini TaxID=3093659 RepID=UPI002AC92BC9|nr:hypothetical protein [Acutalibacter sp. M00204]